MLAFSWLRRLQRRWFPRRAVRRVPIRRRVRLGLEVLEDRTVPAAISTTGDLFDAIQSANAAGGATTITLAAGTTFDFTAANDTTNGSNALPAITADITIIGNNDIIERTGAAAFRLFDVAGGGSLDLENLTLTGGLAQGTGKAAEGGAVYNSGNLTLNDVTVQGNTAQGVNGASHRGGFPGDPGASAYGGGVYAAGKSVVLSNDTFSGNTAQGGNGGNGSTISSDVDGGNGGAGGAAAGGGLYVVGGTVTLTNDTLIGNNVHGGNGGNGGVGTGPDFTGPSGGDGGAAAGGGLYVANGTVMLTNDTLSGNNDQGGNGGSGSYGEVVGGSGGNGGNASGGGVDAGGNVVVLTNTLIAQDNVTAGGGGGGGRGINAPQGRFAQNGAHGSDGTASAPDLSATAAVGDHDLIGDGSGSNLTNGDNGDLVGSSSAPINPLLGPLQNNGGPTPTMALLAGSPAIDAGNSNPEGVKVPNTDQRGLARLFGNAIDIGAFEYQTTFNVAAGNVYGPGGLITALTAANANGDVNNIINLAAGTYDLTQIDNYWYGPNGLPAISSNITINGNGAVIERDTVPANKTPNFRLFYVSGGFDGLAAGNLTMNDLTLEGGMAKGGNSDLGGGGLGAGGALFNQGTVALTGVTLTNNQAVGGNTGVGGGQGGGGMGSAATGTSGGGFGGSLGGTFGGGGGSGSDNSGGGGGGFLLGDNGQNAADSTDGVGGGQGGFGSVSNDGGAGASGSGSHGGGAGGDFGSGGSGVNIAGYGGGGGGGVGGGGGAGGSGGGGGGFGGGGGVFSGVGGFGGGGGAGGVGGAGGFGGGTGGNAAGGGGAGMGGAIFNMFGTATFTNCTLSGNTALGASGGGGYGGAVFNLDGNLNLTFCTLAANTVNSDGGAVYNLAYGSNIRNGTKLTAKATILDSILAGSSNGVDDLANNADISKNAGDTATITFLDNNVVQKTNAISGTIVGSPLTGDPMLGTLQDNGGPTWTMTVAPTGSAYQHGTLVAKITYDQRGLPRSPTPSLGAFEAQASQIVFGGSGYASGTNTYSLVYNGNSQSGSATAENVGGGDIGVPTLSYYQGTHNSVAGLTPLDGVPTDAGDYTVLASFGPTGDYTGSSAVAAFNIAKANAVITVTNYNGTYDGNAHGLSGSATGVSASDLDSSLNLGGKQTNVGTYTVPWSFSADNYNSASSIGTITIKAASPTVSVTDKGGVYNGNPFPASATALGVDGKTPVDGKFTYTYYNGDSATGTPLSDPPSKAGTYTAVANFTSSDTNYSNASAQTTFTINAAAPTITVSDDGGVYNGNPFSANGTATGLNGATVGGHFTYYYFLGVDTTGASLGSQPPSNAGTYTVVAAFTSTDANYSGGSAQTTFIINATTAPALTVRDAGGVYNGNPFPAAATATGVGGVDVKGSFTYTYYCAGNLLSGPPSNAGSYTVIAAFTSDDANYADGSTQTTFSINPASTAIAANFATTTFLESPQDVELTAHVTGGDQAIQKAGTVTFQIVHGSSIVGTATTSTTLDGNGDASVLYHLPAALSAGGYTIDATYNPPVNFAGSTDATHFLIVNAATTTTTTVDVTTTFSSGVQNLTLTANVSSPAGPVNEGKVLFTILQGSTPIGSASASNTVHNGQASVVYVLPANTATGAYTLDAVYNPGADFLGSGATALVFVNAAATGGGSSPNGGSTPIGASAPNGSAQTQTSTGLLGLALEEFELTLYSAWSWVYQMVHLPDASLQATIASLQTAIPNNPLAFTSEGQLAILLGQVAAWNVLSGS